MQTAPFTHVPTDPQAEFTFHVRRGDVAGAFTASFVATDACGETPSFAGAGVDVP